MQFVCWGSDFASFYGVDIWFWNCSEFVVFFVIRFMSLLSQYGVLVLCDLILQCCEVTHVINMILTKLWCIKKLGVGYLRTRTSWRRIIISVYALKVTKNKNANC